MVNIPSSHDPLQSLVSKVYVLPTAAADTAEKVAAIIAIARQHQIDVESHDSADGNTRVILNGTLLTISNAATTVKAREDLQHVFASELLAGKKPRATHEKPAEQ